MKLRTQLKLLVVAMTVAGGFSTAIAAEIEGGAAAQSKPMSSKLGAVTQKRLNLHYS